MGLTPEQQRYEEGYREGRMACLTAGDAASARAALEAKPGVDSAYVAGFEWAVWDYNDANGLMNGRAERLA